MTERQAATVVPPLNSKTLKMGLSENFYSSAFGETEKNLGDEAQAWADDMSKIRKDLVLTVVGLAAGGEEGAVEFAREQGKGYATSLLEGWVGRQVQVPPERAPTDLIEESRASRTPVWSRLGGPRLPQGWVRWLARISRIFLR